MGKDVEYIDKDGNKTIRHTQTTDEDLVVHPYRFTKRVRMPYYDTMRDYAVAVYNSDNKSKDGTAVSPEDAERFEVPWGYTMIEGDTWEDPSENSLNWTLAGGLGALRALPMALNGVKEVLPYTTARGWLSSTSATNSTPAWLTPKTAALIDATLFGAPTGASMNDWYLNGPTVENIVGTAAGLGGLATEAWPTLMEGYNFGKKAYNTFLLGRNFNKSVKNWDSETFPLNVGWGPHLTFSATRAQTTTDPILSFSPEYFDQLLSIKEYTNKYLELLGDTKELGKFEGNIEDRSLITRPFAEYLELLGIDSSLFTEKDLNALMKMRSKSVRSSMPQSRRSAVTYETKPRNLLTIFSIDINEGDYTIGEIQARSHNPNHPRANEVPIDMISRSEAAPSKGLSEDAYNAAIDYIKQTNIGKGLVSGERLLSPEITYKVWEHYPNRILLRNNGHHSFGTGRDVISSSVFETHEGPVVMLTEPSKSVIPMKSSHIFHPDMIENGKLLPPNWTKYGIYYSIPLLLGINGMYTNKKINY